jgi:hypothetical protein
MGQERCGKWMPRKKTTWPVLLRRRPWQDSRDHEAQGCTTETTRIASHRSPGRSPGTDTAARGAGDAALAADQVSLSGAQVRLLGAIVVPEEEICFYPCQASSADTVRAAMTHVGLRPDRITLAILIRTPCCA